jgi:hypothetical protein
MTRSVVFTASERPAYLRQTLQSWAQARGIEDAELRFHVEPGNADVLRICNEVSFGGNTVVYENPERCGVLRNPWHALTAAFLQPEAEFAILAEDDIVVSQDVLDYFAWCSQEFRARTEVIAVSARQHTSKPGGLNGVHLGDMGQPPMMWVWGTWRDRWNDLLSASWDLDYSHGGWDWHLHNYWVAEREKLVAQPAVSRCQHIGRYGGTHCTPDQFDALSSLSFIAEVPPQSYRLIDA